MQSTAPQSAVVDRVTVDKEHPMWWYMLTRAEQLEKIAAADKAVDLLWPHATLVTLAWRLPP